MWVGLCVGGFVYGWVSVWEWVCEGVDLAGASLCAGGSLWMGLCVGGSPCVDGSVWVGLCVGGSLCAGCGSECKCKMRSYIFNCLLNKSNLLFAKDE